LRADTGRKTRSARDNSFDEARMGKSWSSCADTALKTAVRLLGAYVFSSKLASFDNPPLGRSDSWLGRDLSWLNLDMPAPALSSND
jgi:hypothetical protein